MGAQLTHRLSAPSLQKENGLEGNRKPEGKARPSSVFASCFSDDAFKNTRGKRKNGGRGERRLSNDSSYKFYPTDHGKAFKNMKSGALVHS